jgi:hypothetical protein
MHFGQDIDPFASGADMKMATSFQRFCVRLHLPSYAYFFSCKGSAMD